MSSLSITVDTTDKEVLHIIAKMLNELAGDATVEVSTAVNLQASEPVTNKVDEGVTPPLADGWPTGANPITDLDADGLPWDARIHASTKTKTTKDLWKKRKGIDKDVITQVETELKQVMAIPVQDQQPPATQETVIQPPATQETVIQPPATQETVIQPPATQETVIQPPATQETVIQPPAKMTFAEFVKGCGTKISGGQITMARILEIINGKGIPSLQSVMSRPDLIPELWGEIDAL